MMNINLFLHVAIVDPMPNTMLNLLISKSIFIFLSWIPNTHFETLQVQQPRAMYVDACLQDQRHLRQFLVLTLKWFKITQQFWLSSMKKRPKLMQMHMRLIAMHI